MIVGNCQELHAELQTLEKLCHQRIVQYYGYTLSAEGSLVIFMEYMAGVSELFTWF